MEEQIKPNKKKSKLKIFGIIIISLFIVISIIVVVGYNNYTNEQENKKEQILTNELEKQIEEQTGQDVEVINTAKQPDYTIHNPLTNVNSRHSVVNGSNDEVFYYAHDGSVGGIGNLYFNYTTTSTGFFFYLGSSVTHIIGAWIDNLFTHNINATNSINATEFYEGNERLALNSTISSNNVSWSSTYNNSYVPYNDADQNVTLLNVILDIFTLRSNNTFINLLSGLRSGYIKAEKVSGSEFYSGYDYCESIQLYKGWNGLGLIFNKTNDYTDRNVSIGGSGDGLLNLIGYSAEINYPIKNIKFTNSSGYSCYYYDCYMLSDFVVVSGQLGEGVGISPDKLYKNDAFWIKSTQNGNLTFEGVGGTKAGETYNWADLRFSDGTTELSITDAGDAGWICNSPECGGNTMWYWGCNLGALCSNEDYWTWIDIDSGNLSSWKGYFIYSNKDNIYMITNNNTCLGKFIGNVSWMTNNGTLTGINTTEMTNNGGTLTFVMSWFTGVINTLININSNNFYNATNFNNVSQLSNDVNYRNETNIAFSNGTNAYTYNDTYNTFYNTNNTIARAGSNTSTCPEGQVAQNITLVSNASGIFITAWDCVDLSIGMDYTNVGMINQTNQWTANQNFSKNISLNGGQINLDGNATIGRSDTETKIFISESGNVIVRFSN